MIIFDIPGQPVAKGRPRFARRGAFVSTYTPKKTEVYENLVKAAAFTAMAGRSPLVCPVILHVVINLQIPVSWSKRKQAKAAIGEVAATKKPDADNVLKSVKDGVNGVVWRDDSQVIQVMLTKRYSEIPSVAVRIEESSLECA